MLILWTILLTTTLPKPTKSGTVTPYVMTKEQIETLHKEKQQQQYECDIEYLINKHQHHRKMDYTVMYMLAEVEYILGRSLKVNSGYRSHWHNRQLIKRGYKASPNSAHCGGYAFDLAVAKSERFEVIQALFKVGFNRIGIGHGFIHVDIDPHKPENKIWTY